MVVDSTDRKRMPMVKMELFKLLASESLKNAVLLVYANKQDAKKKMSEAEIATELNVASIKTHNWHIQTCCALTGEGLYEGMDWIVSNVGRKG